MTEEAKLIVAALRTSCEENGSCPDCPVNYWCHAKNGVRIEDDAADLIESLSEQLEQVTRERDAAFRHIKRGCRACSACRYGDDTPENNEVCDKCIPNPEGYSEWQWEGVEVTNDAQKGSDAKS